MPDVRISISLLGARQHYAVPRAAARVGALHAFYTDLWVRPGLARLLRTGFGAAGRRLAGRYHEELRLETVKTVARVWPAELLRRRKNRYDRFVHAGKAFSLGVNRLLGRGSLDPERDAFLGFSAACLETLDILRSRGILTITDQVDPLCAEFEIVAAERRKWPGWEPEPAPATAAYIDRVREEWRLASCVLVNSAWTRDALVQQGVPREKLCIIPQAYESRVRPSPGDYDGGRPLRVLWLGSVILRKGIPYLCEASRLLGDRVEVRVVGPVGIDAGHIREAPSNMSFPGPVPRTVAARHFRWADVFVLPTLSDGFAITQLEAMAHGLPVVTTPCCGEVVTDHEDGLIVKPADSEALATALEELAGKAPLVREMSANCPRKVREFSLEAYGRRLLESVKGRRTAQHDTA